MTEPHEVTDELRMRFLKVLGEHANVGEAVRATGLPRRRALALRAQNEEFAADWDAAIEDARDRLELAAWTRALDGVAEPYFYAGEERGNLRRHPDGLLQTLLKAERPEKFGDGAAGRTGRKETVRQTGGGVLVVPEKPDPKAWAKAVKDYKRHLANGAGS